MAGVGMKLVSFMIVVHALLWFAGSTGMVEHQAGETNQHREFVDKFENNATQTVDVTDEEEEASIFDSVTLAIKSIPFIGFVYEVFETPYAIIGSSGLPEIYKILFNALMGFFQSASIVSFIRGYDF